MKWLDSAGGIEEPVRSGEIEIVSVVEPLKRQRLHTRCRLGDKRSGEGRSSGQEKKNNDEEQFVHVFKSKDFCDDMQSGIWRRGSIKRRAAGVTAARIDAQ